jgi:uncharacterized protein
MYIKRKIEGKIFQYLKSPEIIAIIGSRQCGKTTLLKRICDKVDDSNFVSFESIDILELFEKNTAGFIDLYVKNKKYLFIDEFQYAKNGGKKLKYIFDNYKIKIFLSGSSSIDLTVNALRFLVGRIFIFELFPLDFAEFISYKDSNYSPLLEEGNKSFDRLANRKQIKLIDNQLTNYFDEYLIYGGYPRVVLSGNIEEKKEVLKNIYNTYFLREVKDVLGLIEDFKLNKLIKALSLQVGSLIEYNELSRISELSFPTLKKYLNFLEKTFITSFLKPYYNNKRLEIVKNPKVYFFDTGLRNVIANDFRAIEVRNDAGGLIENGVFSQLIKNGRRINFWRTKLGKEMDFIMELEGGKIIGIEIKNKQQANSNLNAFRALYPNAIDVIGYRIDKIDKKGLVYPLFCIY